MISNHHQNVNKQAIHNLNNYLRTGMNKFLVSKVHYH